MEHISFFTDYVDEFRKQKFQIRIPFFQELLNVKVISNQKLNNLARVHTRACRVRIRSCRMAYRIGGITRIGGDQETHISTPLKHQQCFHLFTLILDLLSKYM